MKCIVRVKGSGISRFGGNVGIAEFTELRWIALRKEQPLYSF